MEVEFMTKTEAEKRFKRIKNFEQTVIIWSVGSLLLVMVLLIEGDTSIGLQALAGLAFILMIFGWMIGLLHRVLKKRELLKYDTGTLAMIADET
jgi:uncharacterized Tic20 family protein